MLFKKFEWYILSEKKSLISGPFGSNISSKFFVKDGVPVIRGNNLNNLSKKFNDDGFVFITKEKAEELNCFAYPNDIIFTAVGTIGQVGIITDNLKYKVYTISNKQIRARIDKSKIDVDFAYIILNSIFVRNQIIKGNTGSTVPLINLSTVRNLLIPQIELNTQQKIVSVISALDNKIELNNKINAELEAMTKTLYDYWFVQFDFPNAEGKPYKSSGGEMFYDEVLKREIPKGWEFTSIGDIAELIRGVSYSKDDIESFLGNNSIRILRATNISLNRIDLNNPVIVANRLVDKQQLLNKYDILLTMSSGSIDHIGKNGFYYFDEEVSFGAFCAKLVPKLSYRYYLYQYMQSPFLSATLKNECLGTNINNLNSSMVKGFKLVKPCEEILDLYSKTLEKLFLKIENNTKQNQELASLRDWLLPMLMNGQVTIKDACEMVEGELGMVAEGEVDYKTKN